MHASILYMFGGGNVEFVIKFNYSKYVLILSFDKQGGSIYNSKMSITVQREAPRMVRPLSRKDIFYSGSVVNLPEYQSQKSLTNYRNSVMSLPQTAGAMSRQGDVERQERE